MASYSGLLLSDLVEIPGLGIADCILITGVPKQTGQTWTASGIDNPGTTRLTMNTNVWATTASGDEIACAAASAASGDTTGDIYLYPRASLTIPLRAKQDQDIQPSQWETTVFNRGLRSSAVPVDPSYATAISAGVSMYLAASLKSYRPDNTDTNAVISSTLFPVPSGSNREADLRQPVAYGYGKFPHEGPLLSTVKVVSGSVTYPTTYCRDANGDPMSAGFLSPIRYGEHDGNLTGVCNDPADPSNSVITIDTTDAKIASDNSFDDFAASLLNDEEVWLVPRFGSGLFQTIPNCVMTAVVDNGSGNDTYSYVYSYSLRRYSLLRKIGFRTGDAIQNLRFAQSNSSAAVLNPAWVPCLPVDLPTNFNVVSSSGPAFSPPGALDYSDRYAILTISTSNAALGWQIFNKNPAPGQEETIQSSVLPRRFMYYANNQYPRIRTISGDRDFGTNINNLTLTQAQITDLTIPWDYSLGMFEGGAGVGTAQIEFSLWRVTNASGSSNEQQLTAWANMTKTLEATWSGPIDSYRFTLPSNTLASLGVTGEESNFQANYFVKYRQYYVSVSPYLQYSAPWGTPVNLSLNNTGAVSNYNNLHKLPYPYKIPRRLLTTQAGVDIDFMEIEKGYHYPIYAPSISWAGGVTHEVAAHTNGLLKFRLVSNRTPSYGGIDITQIVYNGIRSWWRLKRMSDGMYLMRAVTDATTTAVGMVWTKFGVIQYVLGHASTTMGSNPGTGMSTAAFPIAWTSQYYIFDRPPGATSEEYELEFCFVSSLLSNRSVTGSVANDSEYYKFTFTA